VSHVGKYTGKAQGEGRGDPVRQRPYPWVSASAPEVKHSSIISHSSTLFVSNLAYDVTSTDLQTAFSDLAPVRSAFVVLESGSGVSKGVGYVSFSIKEDAETAFESLTTNGMAINGRNIRVQWAENKVTSY